MSLGLGHPFLFNTTLNLVLQFVTATILFFSLYFKMKKQYKKHGASMGIATILHVLTFLLIMGPIFYQNYSFFSTEINLVYVQTNWLHAIPGAITLLLAIYLVLRWTMNTSKIEGCFRRKRIMDLTVTLWIFSLVFGIVTYVFIYF